MLGLTFLRDRRASATRWFAYAALAITVTAAAGAHGLAWVARSGRLPVIAFIPLNQQFARGQSGDAVDLNATGSIGTRQKATNLP